MLPDALPNYARYVIGFPGALWGYCGQRLTDEFLRPLGIDMHNHFDLVQMIGHNVVCHGMSIFRKDLFLGVGGYNESIRIGEDYDLFLRFLEHADPLFHNQIGYFYRRHASNSNNVGHTETVTAKDRLNDAPHRALAQRIENRGAAASMRMQAIAAAWELTRQAAHQDWPAVLTAAEMLNRLGVSSLWKDC
jgi:hypothetical protein